MAVHSSRTKMKKYFLSLLLLASGFHAGFSCANTFDPVTNILTMDSVTVGNQQFVNVVVRIDQFAVLGAGNSYPVEDGILETCQAENLTTDRFGAIQVGMTVDQVTQIIGCKYRRSTALSEGRFSINWGFTVFEDEDGIVTLDSWKKYNIRVTFDETYRVTPSFDSVFSENDSNANKSATNLNSPAVVKNTATTFDLATKVLAIDSVRVTGGLRHENVTLSVENFTLLAVGGSDISTPPSVTPDPVSPPPPVNSGVNNGISTTCTSSNFTIEKYNSIQIGMSLEQVTQIIGCNNTSVARSDGFAMYRWQANMEREAIFVVFRESSLTAASEFGSSFKMAVGF
jgi:hypothetical protein